MKFEYSQEIGVGMERPLLSGRDDALLIIDMVEGQTNPDVGKGKYAQIHGKLNNYYYNRVESVVIPALSALIAKFREKELPVVHVRYRSDSPEAVDWPLAHRHDALERNVVPAYPGCRDSDWTLATQPAAGELTFDKRTISAFNSTNLASILLSRGVRHLVVAGVATPYGVGHTAIDATDHNFFVTIPVDCVAGMSQESETSWLDWASQFYVRLSDSVSLSDELDFGAHDTPRLPRSQ